jgi:hypothetical protein
METDLQEQAGDKPPQQRVGGWVDGCQKKWKEGRKGIEKKEERE